MEEDHREKVEEFAYAITTELSRAFNSSSKTSQTRREMWGQYHTTRTSSKFIQLWVQFLNKSGIEPLPTLYQHLTSLIFKDLVKEKFPVVYSQPATPSAGDLDPVTTVYLITRGKTVVAKGLVFYISTYIDTC